MTDQSTIQRPGSMRESERRQALALLFGTGGSRATHAPHFVHPVPDLAPNRYIARESHVDLADFLSAPGVVTTTEMPATSLDIGEQVALALRRLQASDYERLAGAVESLQAQVRALTAVERRWRELDALREADIAEAVLTALRVADLPPMSAFVVWADGASGCRLLTVRLTTVGDANVQTELRAIDVAHSAFVRATTPDERAQYDLDVVVLSGRRA